MFSQLQPDPVESTSRKLENAAFFFRLGLPSTLIRQENRAFPKTLFTPVEFGDSSLAFLVLNENIKTEYFENANHVISPSFPQKPKSKIVARSKFSDVVRT